MSDRDRASDSMAVGLMVAFLVAMWTFRDVTKLQREVKALRADVDRLSGPRATVIGPAASAAPVKDGVTFSSENVSTVPVRMVKPDEVVDVGFNGRVLFAASFPGPDPGDTAQAFPGGPPADGFRYVIRKGQWQMVPGGKCLPRDLNCMD